MGLKSFIQNPLTALVAPATIPLNLMSRYGDKQEAQGYSQGQQDAMRLAQEQASTNAQGRQDLIYDQFLGKMKGQQLFGSEGNLALGSQEILDRRQDLSKGLEARELDAARTQGRQEINANTMGQLRNLQAIQGAQGLKGGLAAAQQRRVLSEGGARVQDMERDLILANVAARRQGLQDYSQEVNRRLFGIQASETGQAQLGLQQRGLEQGLALAGAPAPQPSVGLLGGVTQELSVICTEMNRQGLLSKNIRIADEIYGHQMRKDRPEVYYGYYLWAKHVVRLMRKSKRFSKFVCFLALPWAKEMAYEMGYLGKGSIRGKIIMKVGVPLCGILGKIFLRRTKYANA